MEYKDDNNEMVFHYSREHRLDSAPQSVKDYYSGNMPRIPTSIFKVFRKNRTAKLMFFVLILLTVSFFFTDFLHKGQSKVKVNKTKIELVSFAFGDEAFANLSFSEISDYNDSVPLIVEFCTYDKSENLLDKKQGSGLYNGQKTSVGIKFTNFDIYKIVANFEYLGKNYSLISILK